MTRFSGNDLRDLRKSHRLSRHELGAILGVAPVTVEKWEQSGEKPIRPKYHAKLIELAGAGVAGAGIGLLAAPALLPAAGILGLGALGIASLVSDAELEKASTTIEKLKRLDEDERAVMVQLLLKMNG